MKEGGRELREGGREEEGREDRRNEIGEEIHSIWREEGREGGK